MDIYQMGKGLCSVLAARGVPDTAHGVHQQLVSFLRYDHDEVGL